MKYILLVYILSGNTVTMSSAGPFDSLDLCKSARDEAVLRLAGLDDSVPFKVTGSCMKASAHPSRFLPTPLAKPVVSP